MNASVSCGAGLEESATIKWVTSFPNDFVEDSCDYLIITHNNFYTDPDAKSEIESLAQHRADFNGFNVVMTKTSSIYSAFPDSLDMENDEKIKELIKNTYNNGSAYHTYDGKIAYVNLFGDVDLWNGQENVPTHYEDPDHGGYDVYFTQLTYDSIAGEYDPYPDIMIGRCSVDDTEQVKNVVHKILHYKPDTLSWKKNMLNLVGTETGEGIISSAMLELDAIIEDQYNITLAIPDNFAEPVPDWNTTPYILDSIQNVYQQGIAFFNYFGHGAVSHWQSALGYYSNIPASSNYNLPFVISAACYTGAFQAANDCLGEKFLSSDSAMGAIGFIGATEVSALITARITPLFQKAVLKNYSVISGEAFMEVKLADANLLWNDDYILLGDPALNILNENTDTLFPELVIKDFEIGFNPQIPNAGDTLLIRPVIRNMTRVSATNGFYVSCKAIHKFNQDTIWIDNAQIDSLSGYTKHTANFQWITGVDDFGAFEFVFEIDTSNCIMEMDENNNRINVNQSIYLYNSDINFTSSATGNSNPVSFDIDNSYSGEEICFGRNILSSSGNTISLSSGSSSGFTSIGNLTNNEHYQVIIKSYDSINCIGTPSWSYPCPSGYTIISHHSVLDLDQNGTEEILFIAANHAPDTKLFCLNNDGTLRWDHLLSFTNSTSPISCLLNNINTIIITNTVDKIYCAIENGNSLTLSDSITIPNCTKIEEKMFAADFNKDGDIELVLKCQISSPFQSREAIALINLKTQDLSIKTFDVGKEYYFHGISDINNNGNIEIITLEKDAGLFILNNNLDSLIFISETSILPNAFASGDFNQDGKNDIVCNIQIDGKQFIRIYEATGNGIMTIPIISSISGLWISDIKKNGNIEIISSANRELFVIDVPGAGTSIGWPGQRGNVRNTGVLLQPAYMPNTDTVYWYNTLLVTDSLLVDSSQTLVIKPGTVIKSDASSQILVYGKLIAEGTANHPITFTADTMNANNDYWQGITFGNGSASSLKHVKISNAEFGILYEDFTSQTLENCTFTNNEVGVGAFNSSPGIFECTFTNNEKAIGSYSNASPVLSDLYYDEEYHNVIVDNDMGIYVASSSVYLDEGYNDIYNSPASGYYIYSTTETILGASLNYWGSTSIKAIQERLYPSSCIGITPICTAANTNFKSTNPARESLLQAYANLRSGDIANAELKFKEIIVGYPDKNEAYLSVSGLFACYKSANENWGNLETYFTELYNDSVGAINNDLLFGYINLCKRELGKYSEAITNYESIILNNPTYNDSVFAVINIGNAYREAGSYKTSLGTLGYLRPASDAGHIKLTIDLLKTLRPENTDEHAKFDTGIFQLEIFPNPASKEFTIRFISDKEQAVGIKIVNNRGNVVKHLKDQKAVKGENFYTLKTEGLSSGVYYVSLIDHLQNSRVKKLIVLN
ncbi:MAG: T9SS type A sorting domain-containing protein [Bacteroidales bacterium]|nr:T9SS type A sorting domain-containing protein [Bacteroidales bacterium]